MTAAQTSGLGFTGQSVRRVEDERLLLGKGEFVADVDPDGVLHAAFARSPFPHATIVSIDVSAAQALRGVVRVFTAAEINDMTNPAPPFLMFDGLYTPSVTAMSDQKVRHVGDPVAIVVAESRYIAEDAIELIDVRYDDLPGIGTMDQAIADTDNQVWELADGNVLADTTDTFGEIDDVFAAADHVITETFDSQRQTNQPMETRGSLVMIDPRTGHMTIHNTSQAPHFLRWAVAAMLVNDSGWRSLGRFLRNPRRGRSFMAAAKEFLLANRAKLQKQDNAGMISQVKKDRSFLKHMGRMAFGLLAADDFPTVKAVDIGGGFGSKGPVAREDIAVAAAAKALGRSVQWIEDRVENLTDGGQAREERLTMSLALDADGTFRGLKCDGIIDQGAYPGFPIGAPIIKQFWKVYMPGPYDFAAFQLRCRIVTTNKGKVIPYRGPWANETWGRERIIDKAARELGIDPGELRRRNMIGEEKLPMSMITGPDMDETMSAKKTLERALDLIDRDEIASMKADAEGRNHCVGLGIATYHEAAPGPPNFMESLAPGSDLFQYEDGRATIRDDGRIVMYTSQSPHGQSHQTTYKQVVADEFGVPMEDVEIVWGDTDRTQFSLLGTGASRGAPMGAGVMRATAAELRSEVVDVAADMLEASVDDIEIVDGNIHVAGVPARGITYADVAMKVAEDTGTKDGPVFERQLKYEGTGNGGWSVATHVAVVDIDLDTGLVEIPRYLVVEDCGKIINPAIVDGQVRGGVAQGIGAVFYEHAHYDADANLQTSTYMDYLIPTAMEIPAIEIDHMETITAGDIDSRGTGEGGMIGAPAALTNAVSDALGVQVTTQYLPPSRILELAGVITPE